MEKVQNIKKSDPIVLRVVDSLSPKLFHASIRKRENIMQTHIHEFYEIHLVLDGNVTQWINGEKYNMCKGYFYFLNPYDLHKYKPIKDILLAKCLFDISILPGQLKETIAINNSCYIAQIFGDDFEFAKNIFQKLKEEEENDSKFNKESISFLISELIIIILRSSGAKITHPNQGQSFNSAISYIHSHYHESFSLKDISKIAGFAPNYFCTVFKEKFGITLKSYIRNLKIKKATSLLISVENNISEIAQMCGYNSFSQFTSDFKKYTGKTPKKYKEKFKI